MNARPVTTKRGLFSLSVFALLLCAVVAAQAGYGHRADASVAATEHKSTLLVLRLASMVRDSGETGY